MSAAPVRSHASRAARRSSSESGWMPVSPWMGSSRTAAVSASTAADTAGGSLARPSLLGRGRQGAVGAPVKGLLEHEDLAAGPGAAGQLDRRLVGLGARVAQKHL